jgi:uncharacterized protein (TIGR00369 family)
VQKASIQEIQDLLLNLPNEDIEIIQNVVKKLVLNKDKKNTYIHKILGLEKEWRNDTLIMRMPITPFTHNTLGAVHGGIIATLLDTTMGTHANSSILPEQATVTVDLQIRYLKVANGKELTCKSRIIQKGKNIVVTEGKVLKEDGKVCAIATGSFFIIPKK